MVAELEGPGEVRPSFGRGPGPEVSAGLRLRQARGAAEARVRPRNLPEVPGERLAGDGVLPEVRYAPGAGRKGEGCCGRGDDKAGDIGAQETR